MRTTPSGEILNEKVLLVLVILAFAIEKIILTMFRRGILFFALFFIIVFFVSLSQSRDTYIDPVSAVTRSKGTIAREWVELGLYLSSKSTGRPTVHARNMFHLSVTMWEAWSLFDCTRRSTPLDQSVQALRERVFDVQTAPLGQRLSDASGNCFNESMAFAIENWRTYVLSYAAHRFWSYRVKLDRLANLTTERIDRTLYHSVRANNVDACLNASSATGKLQCLRDDSAVCTADEARCLSLLQLSDDDADTNLLTVAVNDYRALGIALAESVLERFANDGSAEQNDYEATAVQRGYMPVNRAEYDPLTRGVGGVLDEPSQWQRLKLGTYIDKNGNAIDGYPPFTTPHWAWVQPFALSKPVDFEQKALYIDPGAPAQWGPDGASPTHEHFVDNHSIVAVWSSQLHQWDGVIWNIGPGARGNNDDEAAFDTYGGGNVPRGHSVNPVTGAPYKPNFVLRGDYARVTATFWAEGPMGAETPGAHWFRILNAVLSHKDFKRRVRGGGFELSPLEYEIKAYLSIGAASHDSAIAAWATKRHYNSARPISAIRFLCELGQSSDATLPRFNSGGVRLYPGSIELVTPTAVGADERLGVMQRSAFCTSPQAFNSTSTAKNCENEIAIFSWRPLYEMRWLPGDWWYPYMRPSFVTPTFPGYVSGHSTFARCASDVLESLTGDKYFPGGLLEIFIEKSWVGVSFGERTPSQDFQLQYATFRDAADDCGLSRIWGGVHPPMDDRAGRIVGSGVAAQVWPKLVSLFGDADAAGTRHTLLLRFSDSFVENLQATGASFSLALEALQARVLQYVRDVDGVNSLLYRGRLANVTDVHFVASVKNDPRNSVRIMFYAHAVNTGEKVVQKLREDFEFGHRIAFVEEVRFRQAYEQGESRLSTLSIVLLATCIILFLIAMVLAWCLYSVKRSRAIELRGEPESFKLNIGQDVADSAKRVGNKANARAALRRRRPSRPRLPK